jgi:hypothetical protein
MMATVFHQSFQANSVTVRLNRPRESSQHSFLIHLTLCYSSISADIATLKYASNAIKTVKYHLFTVTKPSELTWTFKLLQRVFREILWSVIQRLQILKWSSKTNLTLFNHSCPSYQLTPEFHKGCQEFSEDNLCRLPSLLPLQQNK